MQEKGIGINHFLTFHHTRTLQVVACREVSPGIVNFLDGIYTIADLSEAGWELCTKDPGYRGMPKSKD